MQTFVDFPWATVASFSAACIGLITLAGMLLPRFGKVRRWIGTNVQDMLGIGGLRSDMQENMAKVNTWIEVHTTQAQKRDEAIALLTNAVSAYVVAVQAAGESRLEEHGHDHPEDYRG